MIKINLLPKDVQEKGKGVEWIFLGAGAILLFFIGGFSVYMMKVSAYQKDLKRKQLWAGELAEMKTKVARVEQLDAQKIQLNGKKNTVVLLLQGRLLYPRFMESFFDALPREIWVNDIALTEDSSKNIKT